MLAIQNTEDGDEFDRAPTHIYHKAAEFEIGRGTVCSIQMDGKLLDQPSKPVMEVWKHFLAKVICKHFQEHETPGGLAVPP